MELILTDYQYAIKILRKVFQFSFASEKTLKKYLERDSVCLVASDFRPVNSLLTRKGL